jgi:nucleoid DNA-binding protein
LEILKFVLASGEDFLISGFGRFQVKEEGERRAKSGNR